MKPGAVEVPVNQRLKLPANIYGAATGSLKVKDAGSFSKEDLWNESSLQWWYNESCRKLRRNYSGGRKPALL